jgi:flagellar basal-body rod modification protein FlgD
MSTSSITNGSINSSLAQAQAAVTGNNPVIASLRGKAATSTAGTNAGAAVAAANAKGSNMNQSDFLLLFTTQLKNQDPTKPQDSTAFVSQLAQFSQLEATTNMSNSLGNLVGALQGNGLVNAAGMVGKTVAVPGTAMQLAGGNPVQTAISLPAGASSVKIDIVNGLGQVVRTETLGAQAAGTLPWNWDGKTTSGAQAPDGNYTLNVAAMVAGTSTTPTVNVAAGVRAVSLDPGSGSLMLTLGSGNTVPMSSVTQILN